jgi:hypothetical protein
LVPSGMRLSGALYLSVAADRDGMALPWPWNERQRAGGGL